LRVLTDWVREGGPGENIGDIVKSASMDIGLPVKIRCPPQHFSEYDTIGLRAAAGKVPIELRSAGSAVKGREELRSLMTRQRGGRSLVLVSAAARWSLNAFSGGLAQGVARTGMLCDDAAQGPYKVLMEALESFAAMGMREPEEQLAYATSPGGRRYLTSMAQAPVEMPSKDQWYER